MKLALDGARPRLDMVDLLWVENRKSVEHGHAGSVLVVFGGRSTRLTRCALLTGVQTCALPILGARASDTAASRRFVVMASFIDNRGSRAVGDVTPTYAASTEALMATSR